MKHGPGAHQESRTVYRQESGYLFISYTIAKCAPMALTGLTDHADISDTSGFYYAMLDLTPSGDYPSPTSPTSPRTALPAQSTTSATSPTSPHAARYSYVPSSATSYASNTNHDLRERLPRRQSNQAAAAIRPSAWARRVSGPGVHDDEPEPEPGPDADADGTPDEEDFGDPTGETEIRSGSGSGDLPALGAGSGGTSAGIAGYFSSAFGRRASTATSPGMDTGTGGSGSRGAANGHVLVGPPPAGRRSSSSVIRESDLQSPTANAVPPTGPQMPPRRRRESSHRAIAEAPREATIRGVSVFCQYLAAQGKRILVQQHR